MAVNKTVSRLRGELEDAKKQIANLKARNAELESSKHSEVKVKIADGLSERFDKLFTEVEHMRSIPKKAVSVDIMAVCAEVKVGFITSMTIDETKQVIFRLKHVFQQAKALGE